MFLGLVLVSHHQVVLNQQVFCHLLLLLGSATLDYNWPVFHPQLVLHPLLVVHRLLLDWVMLVLFLHKQLPAQDIPRQHMSPTQLQILC